MSDGQDTLIQTLAKEMAKDRKVLLVEPSFDLLSVMAVSPIKELAVINADADPDAPSGETATGAPLRIRPDFNERPRSKDLIIDPSGLAPVEAVERLLKKHGVYLTKVENAVTESLSCVTNLTPDYFGVSTIGETPAKITLKTKDHAACAGRPVVAAGRLPVEAPKLSGPIDLSGLAELGALRDSLESLTEELETDRSTLEEAREDLASAVESNDALNGEVDRLTTLLEGASSSAVRAEAELSTVRSEFTELENDYDNVRTQLAEERIADQRERRITERAASTQRELTKEIESLRARLIKLDGPAADLTEVIAERDILRERLADSVRGCHELASVLIAGKKLPAPPVVGAQPSQAIALDSWLTELKNRAEAVSTRDAERDSVLRSVRSRSTHLERKVRLLEMAEPAAPPPKIEVVVAPNGEEDTSADVLALNAALDAERALRARAEQRVDGARVAASKAVSHYDVLREELIECRRQRQAADVARVIAEERLSHVHAELRERSGRMAELEAMLATHHHLHGVMADTVREAESARDEADSARRLAEANLDIMRGEYERLNDSNDEGRLSRT